MSDRYSERSFDARPDLPDSRDRSYVAQVAPVPARRALNEYRRLKLPVLDQGQGGGCVGFALAGVAQYLARRRNPATGSENLSPWMLYELGRRYYAWAAHDSAGCSARAALTAWRHHGLCRRELWPEPGTALSRRPDRADADSRPLAAYLRVPAHDLHAMHAALCEAGVLLATATVHAGWFQPDPYGGVPFDEEILGVHAFTIIAYDEDGFWIQNSWGPEWGLGGLAHLGYEDWLAHGHDVWLAQLGVAVRRTAAWSSQPDLRLHVLRVADDGGLDGGEGYIGSSRDFAAVFEEHLPRLWAAWSSPRLLVYADGGLDEEAGMRQRLRELIARSLQDRIYPLILLPGTGLLGQLSHALRESLDQHPQYAGPDPRSDDSLELLAHSSHARLLWNERKRSAEAATGTRGAARLLAAQLGHWLRLHPQIRLHLAAHSAGALLLGPLLHLLTARHRGRELHLAGLSLKAQSCSLWAPACTLESFRIRFAPAITAGAIERFALFNLCEARERADAGVAPYGKSLLYLISHALETTPRVPWRSEGTPLLGLESSLGRAPLAKLLAGARIRHCVLGESQRHLELCNAEALLRALREFDQAAVETRLEASGTGLAGDKRRPRAALG